MVVLLEWNEWPRIQPKNRNSLSREPQPSIRDKLIALEQLRGRTASGEPEGAEAELPGLLLANYWTPHPDDGGFTGFYPLELRRLEDASFGMFAPADVTERMNEDTNELEISFRLGPTDEEFSFVTPFGKGLDPGFIPAINEALAKTGVGPRFVQAPDRIACFFLAEPAHQRAISSGLLE